jgi:hypothetical protein
VVTRMRGSPIRSSPVLTGIGRLVDREPGSSPVDRVTRGYFRALDPSHYVAMETRPTSP